MGPQEHNEQIDGNEENYQRSETIHCNNAVQRINNLTVCEETEGLWCTNSSHFDFEKIEVMFAITESTCREANEE